MIHSCGTRDGFHHMLTYERETGKKREMIWIIDHFDDGRKPMIQIYLFLRVD